MVLPSGDVVWLGARPDGGEDVDGYDLRGAAIVANDPGRTAASRTAQALFAHVLAISRDARARFNVGPISRPRDDDGAVRAVFDLTAWDRSRAVLAPGQSGSPASPHFADLAPLWANGGDFPLVFSAESVRANVESTLTLVSRQTR